MNRIARGVSYRSWRQLSGGESFKRATGCSITVRIIHPLKLKKHYHSSSAVYMSKRDYYEVLGVARNATKDEIKKKFRFKFTRILTLLHL